MKVVEALCLKGCLGHQQVPFQWAPREDEPLLPPAVPAEETLMMPPHPPQSVDGRGGELLPLLLLLIK